MYGCSGGSFFSRSHWQWVVWSNCGTVIKLKTLSSLWPIVDQAMSQFTYCPLVNLYTFVTDPECCRQLDHTLQCSEGLDSGGGGPEKEDLGFTPDANFVAMFLLPPHIWDGVQIF